MISQKFGTKWSIYTHSTPVSLLLKLLRHTAIYSQSQWACIDSYNFPINCMYWKCDNQTYCHQRRRQYCFYCQPPHILWIFPAYHELGYRVPHPIFRTALYKLWALKEAIRSPSIFNVCKINWMKIFSPNVKSCFTLVI